MKWLSVKEIRQIYNINWYLRYWFYKKHNSEHIVAFKKENNKLYIDYDYFRTRELEEEQDKKLSIHIYCKLRDSGYKTYTIARLMAKKSNRKIEYFHRFMLDVLFSNKERIASVYASKKYKEFIKIGKELLNENQQRAV